MSEHFVFYQLPVIRAWAYRSFAIENNPWTTLRRDGPGYTGMEIAQRKAAKIAAIEKTL